MILLNGKEVSAIREKALAEKVKHFQSRFHKRPALAVVLIGDDPASQVYVKNKELACERVGIEAQKYLIDAKTSQEEIEALLHKLNADPDLHGILVQIPIPPQFDMPQLLGIVSPYKDVDGLTPENMGLLLAGRPRVYPCTPQGVITMMKHYNLPIAGKKAVVVGRSMIVGRPMAQMLVNEDATVTMCHSRTKDLRKYTSDADIVVVAAGKANMLGREDFKKDAVVIDVGITRGDDGKLTGDIRFEELSGWVQAATPVPRGVGPMTISSLLENTLTLAEAWETFGQKK